MLTKDQKIAIDKAIDCLSVHGDGFADVGALTVLQDMVVKTRTVEFIEADAEWLKCLIQNALHDEEGSVERLMRARIWDAFEASGVRST